MLPDALFKPLDLRHVIEETERTYGAHGVVDLLVAALTDRRVRRDSDIDAYLDQLKLACRQTRRFAEIVPVLRRIGVLNPARRPEVAAEIALAHAHLKDRGKALALLEAAFAEQRRLPARRRSAGFCVVAEIAAAVLGRPALAREIAAMGRSLVLATAGYDAEPLFFLDPIVMGPLTSAESMELIESMETTVQAGRPHLSLVRAEAA